MPADAVDAILARRAANHGPLEQNANIDPEQFGADMTPVPDDVPLAERLPQPTGWRILVLPYNGAKETKGGILLSDEAMSRKQLGTTVGYVLKLGPLAYQDNEKFPAGPWCKEGDWVTFARYAGAKMRIEGGEVRILNDDEITAVVRHPDDIYAEF